MVGAFGSEIKCLLVRGCMRLRFKTIRGDDFRYGYFYPAKESGHIDFDPVIKWRGMGIFICLLKKKAKYKAL